ncbi:MAG: hypothetical protein Q9160_008867 [Pyrenula sp. 1 TL-2023]
MPSVALIVFVCILSSLQMSLTATPVLSSSVPSNAHTQTPRLHQRAYFQSCPNIWIEYILDILYGSSGPSVARLAMNAGMASFGPNMNAADQARFRDFFGHSNDNEGSKWLVSVRFLDIVHESQRERGEGRFRIVCHSDLYPSELCSVRSPGESLVEPNTALAVNAVGSDSTIIIVGLPLPPVSHPLLLSHSNAMTLILYFQNIQFLPLKQCPNFWEIPRYHLDPEVRDQTSALLIGLSALRTVVMDTNPTDFRVNPRHDDPWNVPPDQVLSDPHSLGRFAKSVWVGGGLTRATLDGDQSPEGEGEQGEGEERFFWSEDSAGQEV